MADEIRTECGRKDKKSIIISTRNFITVAVKMTYQRSISSAFACKGYLVHFFDGVSFRTCEAEQVYSEYFTAF